MWTDTPIPPEWILDGAPHARSWELHRSRQGGVSMNYWDCTAGRFRWRFLGAEMIQVLEGEVHITDEDGVTRTLREGDTAHFEAGTSAVWQVDEYVRKLAFHRNAQTLPDRLVTRTAVLLRA